MHPPQQLSGHRQDFWKEGASSTACKAHCKSFAKPWPLGHKHTSFQKWQKFLNDDKQC